MRFDRISVCAYLPSCPSNDKKKEAKMTNLVFVCLFVLNKSLSVLTMKGDKKGYHVNRQKFWIVSEILKVSIETRVSKSL